VPIYMAAMGDQASGLLAVRVSATQSAVRNYNGLAPAEVNQFPHRLAAGEPAANVIDDALLDGYAVAGPVSECLGRCRACGDAGTTELGSGSPAITRCATSRAWVGRSS
jgi:hypothetical protein